MMRSDRLAEKVELHERFEDAVGGDAMPVGVPVAIDTEVGALSDAPVVEVPDQIHERQEVTAGVGAESPLRLEARWIPAVTSRGGHPFVVEDLQALRDRDQEKSGMRLGDELE